MLRGDEFSPEAWWGCHVGWLSFATWFRLVHGEVFWSFFACEVGTKISGLTDREEKHKVVPPLAPAKWGKFCSHRK